MPDVTPEAVTAAVEAIQRKVMSDPGFRGDVESDDYYRVALEAAAPIIRAAEQARIRARLVTCRDCGQQHEFGATEDHPNRAPWRPRDDGALGFLDELLGDGELP